jgi:hypothetical protein
MDFSLELSMHPPPKNPPLKKGVGKDKYLILLYKREVWLFWGKRILLKGISIIIIIT